MQPTTSQKYSHPKDVPSLCSSPQEAQTLSQYLENYSGGFRPLVSMSKAVRRYGLTEKQWLVVKKAYTLDNPSIKLPASPGNQLQKALKRIVLPTPMPITIDRRTAFRHFKHGMGMQYGIFTLLVHEVIVLGGNRKNAKLQLKVTPDANGTVDVCRICGKSLVDHTSITTGVGPLCAKKVGIAKAYKSDTKAFMKALEDEFSKIGPTDLVLWSSSIKANQDTLLNMIENSPTTAPDPTKKSAEIINITWLRYYLDTKVFVMEHPKNNLSHLHYKLPHGYEDQFQRIQQAAENSVRDLVLEVVNPETGGKVTFTFQGKLNDCWLYTAQHRGDNFKVLLPMNSVVG